MSKESVSLQDIQNAYSLIKDKIVKTPLLEWKGTMLSGVDIRRPVLLKLENFQKTGSFKFRGAYHLLARLNKDNNLPKKIIAASAGNHAQGVAAAAVIFQVPCVIYMPTTTPLIKLEATRRYGAEVVCVGSSYHEAYVAALDASKQNKDLLYVHAFDNDDIIAGQGTVALEIKEQLNEMGWDEKGVEVVVPIGGGGLISGVSTGIKSLFKESWIHGVVSEVAKGAIYSFESGQIKGELPDQKTLAEGLAVKEPSQRTLDIIQSNVEKIYPVSDREISVAIAELMENNKIVVEGSGAAGLAAAISGRIPFKGNESSPLVFVLCGGNIDMNVVSHILERSFWSRGMKVDLKVVLPDSPGSLAQVSKVISNHGANILEVHHERHSGEYGVSDTVIFLSIETRGHDHVQDIVKELEQSCLHVEPHRR